MGRCQLQSQRRYRCQHQQRRLPEAERPQVGLHPAFDRAVQGQMPGHYAVQWRVQLPERG